MNAPRPAGGMQAASERRLVAHMEEAGAELTRAQIWLRMRDDDFADEQELAKCLGRLTADGRLVREKRSRPGAPEEFVYRAPNAKKPATQSTEIAAAAEPPAQAKESAMPRNSDDKRKSILDFLGKGGWRSPKEISDGIPMELFAVHYNLRALKKDDAIACVGESRSVRYAVKGTTPPAEEGAPEKAPAKRQPRQARPKVGLHDLGVSVPRQAPVPAPVAPRGRLSYAITDEGQVAINDGEKTIQLTPSDIHAAVAFLERTQLIWKQATP